MRRLCRLGGYKLADLTHAAMSSHGRELKRRVCRFKWFYTRWFKKNNREKDAYVLWKWHTPLL